MTRKDALLAVVTEEAEQRSERRKRVRMRQLAHRLAKKRGRPELVKGGEFDGKAWAKWLKSLAPL